MFSVDSKWEFNPTLNTLSRVAPCFSATAEDIQIIHEPSAFYQKLLNEIENAKTRITLASLYIGSEEDELIDCLGRALAANPNLQVHVLVDYLRGTRKSKTDGKNTITLVEPLLTKFPHQFRLSLYHTPNLKGVFKRVVPSRFNEGFGLQHIKCYLFDDNVIVSGANLNRDYFTDRQDRYILFKNNSQLATYFDDLVKTIASFSQSKDHFKHVHKIEAVAIMQTFINKYMPLSILPRDMKSDTMVFPSLQMGLLGVRQDQQYLSALLSLCQDSSLEFTLSSGYLNFPTALIDQMLSSKAKFSVLTASPQANGFYESKGVSRHIPAAYTYLEQQFMQRVSPRRHAFTIFEYNRPGWTWHSKGLWMNLSDKLPFMTTIGSSNYGKRSSERDLEAQVSVWTLNKGLRERMRQNLDYLYENTKQISLETLHRPERRVHPMVKLATRAIKIDFIVFNSHDDSQIIR